MLGELADADGVVFRGGKGGGSGEDEGGGDSDHTLHHRNTSCFLGFKARSIGLVAGKRGSGDKRKRPMFPFKEHEAENTFRGATHIGQIGPLTPY